MDLPVSNLDFSIEQPIVTDIILSDDIFVKQHVVTGKGILIPQHAHTYGHSTMLAVGAIRIWCDGDDLGEFEAPTGIFIPALKKHSFLTLSDRTIFYCLHNLLHPDVLKSIEHHLPGEP